MFQTDVVIFKCKDTLDEFQLVPYPSRIFNSDLVTSKMKQLTVKFFRVLKTSSPDRVNRDYGNLS